MLFRSITDVDACLRLLLSKGISLDDPQLRLLCTQEDVHNFITLIQDKVPYSSEGMMRNMTMVRFPYMETSEPAKLDARKGAQFHGGSLCYAWGWA